MLKLIKCELMKLKRKKFIPLVFLSAFLFPVPITFLMATPRMLERYPNKTIWCFSGYLFDRDIMGRMAGDWPETKELLSYIDVLVDGEFVEEKKDLTKRFKGSANQRTIDVPASLKAGEVVLLEGFE